jgi:hypothetical protein
MKLKFINIGKEGLIGDNENNYIKNKRLKFVYIGSDISEEENKEKWKNYFEKIKCEILLLFFNNSEEYLPKNNKDINHIIYLGKFSKEIKENFFLFQRILFKFVVDFLYNLSSFNNYETVINAFFKAKKNFFENYALCSEYFIPNNKEKQDTEEDNIIFIKNNEGTEGDIFSFFDFQDINLNDIKRKRNNNDNEEEQEEGDFDKNNIYFRKNEFREGKQYNHIFKYNYIHYNQKYYEFPYMDLEESAINKKEVNIYSEIFQKLVNQRFFCVNEIIDEIEKKLFENKIKILKLSGNFAKDICKEICKYFFMKKEARLSQPVEVQPSSKDYFERIFIVTKEIKDLSEVLGNKQLPKNTKVDIENNNNLILMIFECEPAEKI